jgi:hypothetical protein
MPVVTRAAPVLIYGLSILFNGLDIKQL